MTEKQVLKLKGKRVKFEAYPYAYSLHKDVYEGVVEPIETKITIMRDNVLKPFKHIDMMIFDNNKEVVTIPYNKLKLVFNLEVLD